MLVRNGFLSLLSLVVPLLVGVVTVPGIIAGLGLERFGVLTLVWAVIGYASLFDLGVSRALTKRVAQLHGQPRRLGPVVRAGLLLLGLLGLIMGVLALLVLRFFDYSRFAIGEREFFNSALLVAANIPFVIASGGYRGVLEGLRRFYVVALVRLGFGLVTFLVPVLTLQFAPRLDFIIAIMLLARILGCLTMAWASRSAFVVHQPLPTRPTSRARRLIEIKHLLNFGGWITVSNLTSAVMLYADRFVLAYSPHAPFLAFYTTPYEFVTRLFIVPSALGGVLFPYMARGKSFNSVNNQLLVITSVMTLAAVAPVITALILFAPQILEQWISLQFANSASLPLMILSIGVLVNCLAQLYQTYLLGYGKARSIARLHMVEMLVFVPCVYVAVSRFGIEGVAWVWTLRVVIDAAAMLVMLIQTDARLFRSAWVLIIGLLVALLMFACADAPWQMKVLLLSGLTGICAVMGLRAIYHPLLRGGAAELPQP
ncbi:oligosaccharide flippase family protein [Pseudomonas syringae]|uniref:oligosaccharide flippase family protein n=1 Tax=Pseudomonas syringae TaxID=317 RepID=UPI0009B0610B|nr:oligosaccharide flippase family protein [Pseudomonas syringae]